MSDIPVIIIPDWQHVDTYDVQHSMPALVTAKNHYGAYREPISAFMDVTGIWRVLGSKGGMTKVPFAPTMWTALPKPPEVEK